MVEYPSGPTLCYKNTKFQYFTTNHFHQKTSKYLYEQCILQPSILLQFSPNSKLNITLPMTKKSLHIFWKEYVVTWDYISSQSMQLVIHSQHSCEWDDTFNVESALATPLRVTELVQRGPLTSIHSFQSVYPGGTQSFLNSHMQILAQIIGL